ncbi:MAG: metal-dependent transcriptional regulator [Chloroflexi bacterium]|nr:metal-dependent transcriptional regulator [Chloroflexota bacterium]
MARTSRETRKKTPPAQTSPERLSPVAENYLLSLYVLGEEGLRTTAGRVAEHLKSFPSSEGLGTTLPSVLGMVRRMAKEGLLEMTPDKEMKLTTLGVARAEGMVRRHRLAERMVVDLLGLELHKAHVEAHRLEHAISPDLEARIIEKLGNPTTCPFGKPIPGSGYVPPSGPRLALDQAQHGTSYRVDRVPEEDPELLRFLVEQGILPGKTVTVVEASPHRGVITIKSEQGEESLGYGVAARIWVRPCD